MHSNSPSGSVEDVKTSSIKRFSTKWLPKISVVGALPTPTWDDDAEGRRGMEWVRPYSPKSSRHSRHSRESQILRDIEFPLPPDMNDPGSSSSPSESSIAHKPPYGKIVEKASKRPPILSLDAKAITPSLWMDSIIRPIASDSDSSNSSEDAYDGIAPLTQPAEFGTSYGSEKSPDHPGETTHGSERSAVTPRLPVLDSGDAFEDIMHEAGSGESRESGEVVDHGDEERLASQYFIEEEL